jgi:protein SCO1/2
MSPAAGDPGTPGAAIAPEAPSTVGIDEKLGGVVPLDLVFRDEAGSPVALKRIVDSPTILALVYYNCPNVCDVLLMGIAGMLRTLDAVPGKDYRVVTVSIDENEGLKELAHARAIGLETVEKPLPEGTWRFLTGDKQSIARLADSVGYRFVRQEGGFDHPVCLIFLSPEGKITRYLYGSDFLPVEVKLNLLEARAEIASPTVARLLRFCFKVEPKSHRLVLDMLKVVGTATIGMTAILALVLIISGRRKRKPARPTTR